MTEDLIDKILDCPVMATVDVIGGRWKPRILWLLRQGTLRFGMLQRGTGASTRMLTKSLKELEGDCLIYRSAIMAGNVSTAEYAFTDYGRSLIPVLDAMGHWGAAHMAARSRGNFATATKLRPRAESVECA